MMNFREIKKNYFNNKFCNYFFSVIFLIAVFFIFPSFALASAVEVLMVAGGGGGAAYTGGGGGAGGLIYEATHSVTAQGYTVTVGDGAPGDPGGGYTGHADNGGDSVFDNLTAIGGGGGGENSGVGQHGGSGGGAGHNNTIAGTGVSGQGHDGIPGFTTAPNYGAGGGGGAGSSGDIPTNYKGGDGGAGVSTYSSLLIAAGAGVDIAGVHWIAGGGGGGTYNNGTEGVGGNGGGGSAPAGDATPNTGGGGGGQHNNLSNAGAGGSGIVIIRYLTSLFGACTGGTITTDGAYTIHTFTTSGTFTVVDAPPAGFSCSITTQSGCSGTTLLRMSGTANAHAELPAQAPVSIGDSYGGGIVAYILQAGDPGYVADGHIRGIIAATADQAAGIRWYNGSFTTTGATATALGTGLANTDTIMTSQGETHNTYAAGLAREYTGGGYTDWYLPSEDELNKLYLNKTAIGGFSGNFYWSSSESSAMLVLGQFFNSGSQDVNFKSGASYVRAVRSFVQFQPVAAYDNNVVCCTGIVGLGNSCAASNKAIFARMSGVTNAHVEKNSEAGVNYTQNACLSSKAGDIITIGYQSSNCSGYDTTLFSMGSTPTNSMVGIPTAYTNKVCASIVSASLTFDISTNTVPFGIISPSVTGSGSHTVQVATNATGGFALTYNGPTLTSTTGTISAYGSQQSSVAGTAGFGINLKDNATPNIGAELVQNSGTCAAPATDYGTADKYSYVANTTTSIANQSTPADCTYTVSYIANISSTTPAGSYSTPITYIATGTF